MSFKNRDRSSVDSGQSALDQNLGHQITHRFRKVIFDLEAPSFYHIHCMKMAVLQYATVYE